MAEDNGASSEQGTPAAKQEERETNRLREMGRDNKQKGKEEEKGHGATNKVGDTEEAKKEATADNSSVKEDRNGENGTSLEVPPKVACTPLLSWPSQEECTELK